MPLQLLIFGLSLPTFLYSNMMAGGRVAIFQLGRMSKHGNKNARVLDGIVEITEQLHQLWSAFPY